MNIIIKPVITEKMTNQSDKFNRYGFYVNKRANKIQIKQEVEKQYSVIVLDVKTMINPGKKRMRNTRAGVQEGKVNNFKKAIVTLKKGDVIDYYSNI